MLIVEAFVLRIKMDQQYQELMSAAKRSEGASNYHTLVGPILANLAPPKRAL